MDSEKYWAGTCRPEDKSHLQLFFKIISIVKIMKYVQSEWHFKQFVILGLDN